jgi:hypothetical protein
MSHQPPPPAAVPVPPACAWVPGAIVPCADSPETSSIRIEPLTIKIQPFAVKRLDDSRPLDSVRAQRRLGKPQTIQSNRLIVFCCNVRRPGEQTTRTLASNRPHSTAAPVPER